jgi:hypothetical protein
MLVVPDNATAKKVPSVEGMMVYRKDNNKVYVQGDKKLNALAEEKKVIRKYLFENFLSLHILNFVLRISDHIHI